VTLNSKFTGAELEIKHAGKTETVPGSYSWVAMYSDMMRRMVRTVREMPKVRMLMRRVMGREKRRMSRRLPSMRTTTTAGRIPSSGAVAISHTSLMRLKREGPTLPPFTPR
jgi:hypothetical protein